MEKPIGQKTEIDEEMLEEVNGGAWYNTVGNVIMNAVEIVDGISRTHDTAIQDVADGIMSGDFSFEKTKKLGKSIYDRASNITD